MVVIYYCVIFIPDIKRVNWHIPEAAGVKEWPNVSFHWSQVSIFIPLWNIQSQLIKAYIYRVDEKVSC